MSVHVAVIGNGAREHALCWKLSQSKEVSRIFAIPGNAGTATCDKVTNLDDDYNQFDHLYLVLDKWEVQLVIVGPEVPLAKGIADFLLKTKIMCFGPTTAGARIESDKEWAKRFMLKHKIPTAEWQSFTEAKKAQDFIYACNYNTVIKAAGLAGGKGVIVPDTKKEGSIAVDILKELGEASQKIIVEKRLYGEEVSVLAFTDGKNVEVMLPVQDHKRLQNYDQGPNTGGMGAFCPYALKDTDMEFIKKEILQRAVTGLAEENIKYVGVLYAGLMITADGIKVLEFNCRFGDPETQVLMPLLHTDLFQIIKDCCTQALGTHAIEWKPGSTCVAVVIASKNYPNKEVDDTDSVEIEGVEKFENPNDLYLFHGNTYIDTKLYASGGRIFNVVALDNSLIKASSRATTACKNIKVRGAKYRTDIGWKGIAGTAARLGRTTYQSAGVDISAGDNFIKRMTAQIESTGDNKVISKIGGFGALFDIKFKPKEYEHPVLVSGCDGVGTKLKLAQLCQEHNDVGQDLVAMCVNDILAQGAKPLFFLDYFSCSKLKENIASAVISSIAKGCRLANCALIGGETAEMPGFYNEDDYDLAGFAVGVVDKERMLPRDVAAGDKVIYLASSGIHSNGYSLVRKFFTDYSRAEMKARTPFSQRSFAEELLIPTKIYTKEVLLLMEHKLIKAFAHITGGGILGNIGRVLPPDLKVELDASKWNMLPVFGWISVIGNVCETEMLRTFNCGVGAVVIVAPENVDKVNEILKTNAIGDVVEKTPDEPQVIVRNFEKALAKAVDPWLPILRNPKYSEYKRVAVLISGTGTNLKALIESTLRDPLSPARIVLVISSKCDAAGLRIAQQYKIPYKVIQKDEYASTRRSDQPIVDALEPFNIDLVCLAGYMHIVSSSMVEQFEGRMINIHPSLLPAFKGLRPQQQALDAGVKFSGCTVHFASIVVDSGAIIDQRIVPVYPNDTVEILTERIKEQEHELYPIVLKMLASGKIRLDTTTKKVIRNEIL